MSGTRLGTRDAAVNKTNSLPTAWAQTTHKTMNFTGRQMGIPAMGELLGVRAGAFMCCLCHLSQLECQLLEGQDLAALLVSLSSETWPAPKGLSAHQPF